jgi:hypothetical protein
VRPPDNDPPAATQASERITLGLEGLEKEQLVSVGRKPEPLIPICKPTLPLPELNLMTGEDSTFVTIIVPADTNKTPMNSSVTTNFK